jgi:hypothetical protein
MPLARGLLQGVGVKAMGDGLADGRAAVKSTAGTRGVDRGCTARGRGSAARGERRIGRWR